MRDSVDAVRGAARIVRDNLIEDEDLYNAFVASIASALKEIPAGSGIYDVAEAVADMVIGRENDKV